MHTQLNTLSHPCHELHPIPLPTSLTPCSPAVANWRASSSPATTPGLLLSSAQQSRRCVLLSGAARLSRRLGTAGPPASPSLAAARGARQMLAVLPQ